MPVTARCLALLLLLPCAFAAHAGAPLPVEYFSRTPYAMSLQLSPAGEAVAWLRNDGDRTELVVSPAAGGSGRTVRVTDNQGRYFNWVRWASEERLLLSVTEMRRSFGHIVHSTRLLAMDRDGRNETWLTPRIARNTQVEWAPTVGDQILHLLPDDPAHILIAADIARPREPGVYRVDVHSGRRELVQRSRARVRGWLADARGVVRIGMGVDGPRSFVIARRGTDDDWRTLWSTDLRSAGEIYPLGFGASPDTLYVSAPHAGRRALFRVDPGVADPPLQLVSASDRYDVGGTLIFASGSSLPLGLYLDGGPERLLAIDPGFATLQQHVDAALPDRVNYIVSRDRDGRRAVVYSATPGTPGRYLLGTAGGAFADFAESFPELAAAALGERALVRYRARDGLSIEAVLTRPVDPGPAPAPAVILPHGGPEHRDGGGFDPWAAFLADRGYVVLQPNFRGSSGYGEAFRAAGYRRWGTAIQDDIADGTRWLIDQGIADPHRICIAGASFGGYSALLGAARAPGLYRCAASIAGIADLAGYLRDTEGMFDRELTAVRIGSPRGDRALLRDASPRYRAAGIGVPVLLAHGDLDTIVPIAQTAAMARALEAAGREVTFLRLDGGDHTLRRPQHRRQVMDSLAGFLAGNLGAPRP
ncbi:MAG: S9 family peptidase [Gammaproteobacteria bacterium]|nr:S9 family peptidase [Gammaproteobacteria bacterium]